MASYIELVFQVHNPIYGQPKADNFKMANGYFWNLDSGIWNLDLICLSVNALWRTHWLFFCIIFVVFGQQAALVSAINPSPTRSVLRSSVLHMRRCGIIQNMVVDVIDRIKSCFYDSFGQKQQLLQLFWLFWLLFVVKRPKYLSYRPSSAALGHNRALQRAFWVCRHRSN